jgi:hypothetical protein
MVQQVVMETAEAAVAAAMLEEIITLAVELDIVEARTMILVTMVLNHLLLEVVADM